MKRSPMPRRRARPLRRYPDLDPGVDAEARAAVMRRAGWTCEVGLIGCGETRGLGTHHRYRQSHGAVDTAENMVAVCQNCHTDSPAAIHRNVAWAESVGLLIRSWQGPPSVAWSRLDMTPGPTR